MLRPYEWLIIFYFTYVAVVAAVLIPTGESRWLGAAVAAIVIAILFGLTRYYKKLRDWAPLVLTFTAFREMNWFTPAVRDHHLENSWIGWDRWLLDTAHLRAAIESLGPLIPSYLEICYVLVYVIALISALILLFNHRRDQLNTFWFAFIAGTLASYALFPYFPSDPPRVVFAGSDLPHIVTIFRRFNLLILGKYGIHSSVFPSAHVSAAFACAWGLLITMPDRKRYGLMVAIFAFSVAIATIYGRYHFATDALAGFTVSFLAFTALTQRRAAQ
ncbi:MAG TPA: phosphatase PAP2 family protein [Bryobacteraceae bacterium]|nr:phosphatase PAP2 family protein [Bryobacteraceae bacterium]